MRSRNIRRILSYDSSLVEFVYPYTYIFSYVNVKRKYFPKGKRNICVNIIETVLENCRAMKSFRRTTGRHVFTACDDVPARESNEIKFFQRDTAIKMICRHGGVISRVERQWLITVARHARTRARTFPLVRARRITHLLHGSWFFLPVGWRFARIRFRFQTLCHFEHR